MKNKYLKIIFLDIDGVLNLISQGYDKYGSIFHSHFVDNLNKIVEETGASIVISSSWRSDGLQKFIDMWKHRNYKGDVIDVTRYYDGDHEHKRGLEIHDWIMNNDLGIKVSNYVILDDDTDFLPEQLDYFVQTSDNIDHEDCIDIGYGLTDICRDKAIEILNSL